MDSATRTGCFHLQRLLILRDTAFLLCEYHTTTQSAQLGKTRFRKRAHHSLGIPAQKDDCTLCSAAAIDRYVNAIRTAGWKPPVTSFGCPIWSRAISTGRLLNRQFVCWRDLAYAQQERWERHSSLAKTLKNVMHAAPFGKTKTRRLRTCKL